MVAHLNQNIGFGRTPLENTKIVLQISKELPEAVENPKICKKNPQGLSKGFLFYEIIDGLQCMYFRTRHH